MKGEEMERMSVMEVTTIDVPPQAVIGIRRKGPYRDIAVLIGELAAYASQQGIEVQGPPIYLSHEMSAQEAIEADKSGSADLEVVFPVSGDVVAIGGNITNYELPGGKMARIVHKGPYDTIEPAYEQLFKWVGQNATSITGPIREVYINDPSEVAAEEITTEILAPVA